MTGHTIHRLDGLEPDNLLAFIALLGLLRTLEEARPGWRPARVLDSRRTAPSAGSVGAGSGRTGRRCRGRRRRAGRACGISRFR